MSARPAKGNDITIRPDMPNEVYAASDVGVFIGTNGGGSWARMDNGIANAPIAALAVNATTNLLAAATYGRGVWTTALADVGGPVQCTASTPTALCLNDRFLVETDWRTAEGATGKGQAVDLTNDTGYFWFFSPSNVEAVVKVLDGCDINGDFWVFAGGLTAVEVTLTVTDTLTNDVKTYSNAQGNPFQPIQDTGAFSNCPSVEVFGPSEVTSPRQGDRGRRDGASPSACRADLGNAAANKHRRGRALTFA